MTVNKIHQQFFPRSKTLSGVTEAKEVNAAMPCACMNSRYEKGSQDTPVWNRSRAVQNFLSVV